MELLSRILIPLPEIRRTLAGIAATLGACVLLTSGCYEETPGSSPPSETSRPEQARAHGVTGKAPRAIGRFPSVIIFEPQVSDASPVSSEPLLMDQYGMQFHPGVLLLRQGQPLEFRNSEDELHNVHVIDTDSGRTLFNVGIPPGGSYVHTFKHSGVYDVSCHIHPSMTAFIVVTSSPYAVIAGKDGHFELPTVPTGSYNLEVWNVDPAQRFERVMEIEAPHKELILDKMQ